MSVTLRRRTLPSGKIQLYLSININGHRTYETLNYSLTSDRVRNKEALSCRSDPCQEGTGGPRRCGRPPRCRKTQAEFFAFAQGIYGEKPPLTRRTYINAMEHLEEFAGKDLTVARITEKFCEQFLAQLNKGLKPSTAGAYYARFKTIIRALVKARIIPQDPAADIHVRHVDSLPKYLTLEEVHELMKQPCGNDDVREAFLFSCNTGMRYQDVNSLVWKQIRGETIEFVQLKNWKSGEAPAVSLSGCNTRAPKGQTIRWKRLIRCRT